MTTGTSDSHSIDPASLAGSGSSETPSSSKQTHHFPAGAQGKKAVGGANVPAGIAPTSTDTSTFTYNDPNSSAMFSCVETLILALGALNNYLATFSRTILQTDLHKDEVYSEELGGLVFKTGTTPSVTAYNRNIQMEQQTLQSEMKAHENKESMDIQNASGITSDEQQISSMISQFLSAISSISQSIQSMAK